jgi:sugar/nucleoside kinase (ribokinase family)
VSTSSSPTSADLMQDLQIATAAMPAASETELFDAIGVGSALVDVLAEVDEEHLAGLGMTKGRMELVDLETSEKLLGQVRAITAPRISSGGSVANTMAAMATQGSRVALRAKVAGDELGKLFIEDLEGSGVVFAGSIEATQETGTGRCIVLVTPDGERSMATHLGAASLLTHMDLGSPVTARLVFLEAYLWDLPGADALFKAAIQGAERVVLSLSDASCVVRHREEIRGFVSSHVDVLLGNEDEFHALLSSQVPAVEQRGSLSKEDLDAARRGELPPVALVTRGPEPLWIVTSEGVSELQVPMVQEVVDTTGAGDAFAGGFLHGMLQGFSLEDSARLGSRLASRVITHVGARVF